MTTGFEHLYVETHWGTKVAIVQDPDGHRFRIQAPVE